MLYIFLMFSYNEMVFKTDWTTIVVLALWSLCVSGKEWQNCYIIATGHYVWNVWNKLVNERKKERKNSWMNEWNSE